MKERILKSNACSKVGRPQTKVNIAKPVNFPEWFLEGMRKYEAKGAEFELMLGMVKITWNGKPAILRTIHDFAREYQNEYLPRFPQLTKLQFEEGVFA